MTLRTKPKYAIMNISWCTSKQCHILPVQYILITFKIPLKLAQKMSGLTPLTYIVQENAASIALFTGLGFEVSHEASWLLNYQTATAKLISPSKNL